MMIDENGESVQGNQPGRVTPSVGIMEAPWLA
jgi:hypothetical protein